MTLLVPPPLAGAEPAALLPADAAPALLLDTLMSAIDDPELFGPWFKDPTTWRAWVTFLKCLFGTGPWSYDDLQTFIACTGRPVLPCTQAEEAWLICGRRSGKSLMLALLGVFFACFVDWRPFLVPGEAVTIPIIASRKRQGRNIARYVRGMLTRIPMLRARLDKYQFDSNGATFELKNDVVIEIATASISGVRGYSMPVVLCDEVAFWMTTEDSANPDVEVLDALRPAMATFPNSLLLVASSPYSKSGAIYETYVEHYGKDSPVLVWQAPTRKMNPSVSQRTIDIAMKRDPQKYAAEYGAQFRDDIVSFVSREIVQRCVSDGVSERPFKGGIRYAAFVDPSGGSSDSFTMAIGHLDSKVDHVVVDVVREIPAPFVPESAVDELVKTLRAYGIREVRGDRYAGTWVAEAFRKRKVDFLYSEKVKSDLYLDLLPRLNSTTIQLPDIPRLVNQLATLERRTARGGRDTIDHRPGGHDDVANVVAGLAAHMGNVNSMTIAELAL